MLISYKKEFIFIHIFKTAGTSVMDIFLPYARMIERIVYQFWVTKKLTSAINRLSGSWNEGDKRYTGYHKHASLVEVQEKLPPELFTRFFKFAFVRNPYDWLVSFYFYIKQTPYHPYHKKTRNMDFKDFTLWYLEQKPPLQVDFITDKNSEVALDYIGKYETLEGDLDVICTKLGIPFKGLRYKNVSSKRESRDFARYFNTYLIEKVNDYFAKDFEILNYSKL